MQFLAGSRGTRKIINSLLAGIFLFTVAAGIYIHIHYAYTMPQSPQPQTGRVYRIMVKHGTVVYVSKQEFDRANFVFHGLFDVGVVCFGLLAFLKVRLKKL